MKIYTAFLLAASALLAADDTPDWLRSAAAAKLPVYDGKTPAVVLLRASDVTVEETGRIVTVDRFAVRVLSRAGASSAHAAKVYLRDTGKVRDLRAWVIPASGEPRRLAKERYLDVGIGEDALYEDIRARVIDAEKDCDPGAVFGYESVVEEKSIFTQLDWEFDDRLPTRVSRFSLTLPPGWSARAVTINHDPIKPVETNNTQTWELRDLPLFEDEPASPAYESLRPRLALSFFPATGTSTNLGPSFARWEDVSRWLSELHDPQASPDDAIAAKVRSLTAGAFTPVEKIRVLADYVKGIRYVSIQTGLGRGGGYKPHAAALVFAKSYGDCKDKANLLRAMLKAAGIESFPVSIFSGDPLFVREDWPTPQQFNHCILAIRAPDGYDSDAVIDDRKLGRLIVFDPTDPYTPFGELPVHEQNSFALIVAGANGSIQRMPSARADANSTTRKIEAVVEADGSVKGSLHEDLTGWTAVVQRAYRQRGEQEYRKRVETRVTYGIRNAAIENLKAADSPDDGRFQVDLQFSSRGFAQIMQGRLMVFRPSILQPVDPLPFTETKRSWPAVINARSWRDTVRVQLPPGFDIDEMPDPSDLVTPFGTYRSKATVDGGVLTFTRTLVLKSMVVPVADYPALKAFSDRVGGEDQAPIVLAKK
jgi:Domain of Unknown Function with PDB structure (DUF3857)/Transglutaminase-like superfamily